jgi:hypothetical protein
MLPSCGINRLRASVTCVVALASVADPGTPAEYTVLCLRIGVPPLL